MTDFPIFDLSSFEQAGPAGRAARGAEVDGICRTTGFLAISGHSVPEATIATAWNAARTFFDLAPEVKNEARAPYAGYPYGYLGPGSKRWPSPRAPTRRPTSRKVSMAARFRCRPA